MNATQRLGCLATLLLSLAGCANDDWVFRPHDAEAQSPDVPFVDGMIAGDGPVRADVLRTDLGPIGNDVPVGPDVGFIDAGAPDTGSEESDAAVAVDVGFVDTGVGAPDSGLPSTGLTLRSHGIASTAGAGAAAGSLRLTESGFEFSGRACASSLCLAGGLVP